MQARIRHGTPLYPTADVRRIEAQHSGQPLMEHAGLATAQRARELATSNGKPVLIYAGPGNNGGDAFVAARYLKQWFFAVQVVYAGDSTRLPPDAAAAYAQWRAAGGTTIDTPPTHSGFSLIIDGLFGIGLTRDVTGRYAEWIKQINTSNSTVLAIDIPSGLNADTGQVHGCCVRATHTLTFIGAKPGLLTLDGPDHCGEIVVDDLALDPGPESAPGTVLGDATALTPRQPWRINTSGNPGMASAGMGDVLTGIIAALLAQGMTAQVALDNSVWLHGTAADACVAAGIGPVGLTAGETIDAARRVYRSGTGHPV